MVLGGLDRLDWLVDCTYSVRQVNTLISRVRGAGVLSGTHASGTGLALGDGDAVV